MKILSKILGPFTPLVGVAILLMIWQIAFWVEVVDHVLLPSPASMFVSVWQGMTGGQLLFDFFRTIERTALSILYAGIIGIPLGIIFGSSVGLYRSVEFLVDFFRSTPASAVFPLFLAISGPGDATKIQVATFGAALVILFNVAYGVMNARKTRLQAAKVMGAPRFRVLTDVMLFESLPQTFVGLRNGVSLALIIIIVAEMFIGSVDGLGHNVLDNQMLFEMPRMYAAIFVAGALGYSFNLLFLLIERRYVHWSGR